jgi:hypothetical protein
MLKSISRSFMIASFAILSCSKEDAIPTYDFTVAVEPGYFNYDKDAWIIFHDKDGKAIGEGQLIEGQSSKFTMKEKKIGVTIVRVKENTDNHLPTFQLETFLNVTAADAWTLRKNNTASPPCGLALGNVEVIVSGLNTSNDLNSCFGTNGSYVFPDFATSTSNSLHFRPITIYAGCNNAFLYVMDNNQVPHYKILENVNPGQYAYNISQLNNFDKVIDINYKAISSVFLVVSGFDAGQSVYDVGYTTNFNLSYFWNPTTSSIKVGYLNRFAKYSTNLMLDYSGYSMYYEEVGGIPSAITLPETLTATISDKTLAGYTFSVNEDIVYRQVSFGHYPPTSAGESYMDWKINSGPENDFKNLTAAGTQFMSKYPQFKIENLKYQASYFYKEHQTIGNVISQRFGNATRPETNRSVYKAFYK